ncbi:GNAT family N-acetyltransferase [Chitinophaga silvatica]|uniref:GNAT family N-acetyltransferase n=1 Tax=Chitinophaga silvatica TaxID=2282649 RepID=A0A3E1YEP4_9BACT|nr:GNAT family N-acetyltransferase [Chitinophaga silvatica]RFS24949.1 GNAT family N-acetyltransferase [Chitinophaga silvatica]
MYKIQLATVDDIPLIQGLVEVIWPPSYKEILTPEQITYMMDMMYNTNALTQQLNTLNHQFNILSDEDKPIGFASYSHTNEPEVYKLHRIYLDPSYQGKGAGKWLLLQVIEQVKAKGIKILELDVNRFNKAVNFYKKMGFSIYKEKITDVGNGFVMDDYVMRLPL